MDLTRAVVRNHARLQMTRRQISDAEVHQVLARPERVVPVRTGRVVAQAMIGDYLLRVVVDVDRELPEVVTAYRTSKVKKYGGRP